MIRPAGVSTQTQPPVDNSKPAPPPKVPANWPGNARQAYQKLLTTSAQAYAKSRTTLPSGLKPADAKAIEGAQQAVKDALPESIKREMGPDLNGMLADAAVSQSHKWL